MIGNNQQCGFFLSVIKLISNYNPQLKKHLETHEKGSVNYLSPKIQNEFIVLLGNRVRSEIIDRIKKSKYYTMMFDCTPDISHQEQMSQVMRYVYISEGKVMIEESFIDFIVSHDKTDLGLATEILNKLEKDGLEICNARGQSYDSGSNMTGKVKGVKSRILNVNELAKFIP